MRARGGEILLIEDNSTDADLTKRAFDKNNLAGSLTWIRDGEEALDYLFCKGKYAGRDENFMPKVIFLDLRLPKVDGMEVLEIIKKDPKIKTIPVVILTSSKEPPDIRRSYVLGANSFVSKPVNFEEFSTTISNLGAYWLRMNRTIN